MRRKWVFSVFVLVGLLYGLTVLVELNYLSVGLDNIDELTTSQQTPYSHLCPPPSTDPPHCTHLSPPTAVILVGALSFIGSRAATEFSSNGLRVYSLAGLDDTRVRGGGLVWYRKEQLQQLGESVQIIDFFNQTQIEREIINIISEEESLSLVYVPTLDDSGSGDTPYNSRKAQEFVYLLETIRKLSSCVEVLLVSDNTLTLTSSTPSHNAWMESLELLLSSYHSIHSIPTAVLRVGGVYGPWADSAISLHQLVGNNSTRDVLQLPLCWYVNDIVGIIYQVVARRPWSGCEVYDIGSCKLQNVSLRAIRQLEFSELNTEYVLSGDSVSVWKKLNIDKDKLHTVERGLMRTLNWAKAFTTSHQSVRRNVILTSYFTSEMDAQRNRHKRPDRFSYIRDWYKSVARLSLNAVIFHDGLQSEFQHRLSQHHPGVTFEYVPSLEGRSTNDARFYSYLNYLVKHSDIHKVILTDISDVEFQMDPFELMELIGDALYIGTDIDIFPNMQAMPWIHHQLRNCFGNYSVEHGVLHPLMKMNTVYNAGVIGGTRETMLSVLARIVGYLDTTPPQLNCNMPAVNVAVHRHFFDRVFTGFPLTSRFLRRQVSPKGVYIIHK